MNKHKIRVFNSFETADRDYEKNILSMSPQERVRAVEILKQRYFKIKGISPNIRKDIRKIRVIKPA